MNKLDKRLDFSTVAETYSFSFQSTTIQIAIINRQNLFVFPHECNDCTQIVSMRDTSIVVYYSSSKIMVNTCIYAIYLTHWKMVIAVF